jgi:prepilin-type N-terminal cleavage/methylation domain-containing protein
MFRSRAKHVRPGAQAEQAAHRADRVCRAGRGRGFTLIEVVIVMAIIAAVGTIGILRYIRVNNRYRVEAACAKVIADVRLAQTQARTTSSGRTMKFKAASAAYAILTDAEVSAGQSGLRVSLGESPYRATMTTLGMPGDQVLFDGRGEALNGGIVTLKCGDAERAIRIEPGLGRAYVVGTE